MGESVNEEEERGRGLGSCGVAVSVCALVCPAQCGLEREREEGLKEGVRRRMYVVMVTSHKRCHVGFSTRTVLADVCK